MSTTTEELLALPHGEAVQRFDRWLHYVANSLLHWADPDHDDVVQEGRIAMWRAIDTFELGKGTLPPWMTNAARWRMRDVAWQGRPYFGHEAVRGVREPDLVSSEALAAQNPEFWKHLELEMSLPDFAERVIVAYHQGEIHRALHDLTRDQRAYIALRFWGNIEPSSKVPGTTELRKQEPLLQQSRKHMHRQAMEALEFKFSHLRDGYGD